MHFRDLDITDVIREALPVDSFLFNPSIAHITGDTYLISVRSFTKDSKKSLDDNPRLLDNTQHPWGAGWKGDDVTFVLPVVITKDHIQPITTGKWPLQIPYQDARLYEFHKDGTKIAYILTYNKEYAGEKDMIISGGKDCGDYCYIIGWSYLLVDINNLKYSYVPGEKPLCMNISNQVEKNWSLWQHVERNCTYLYVSYGLTPVHSAFTFVIDGVKNDEMVGGSTCRLLTKTNQMKFFGEEQQDLSFFGKLEQYYDRNLFVSLSTPAYLLDNGKYQAVGHLKVKIDYLKKLAKSKDTSNLAKFAREYVTGRGKKHFHQTYIYLMFVYRFEYHNVETDLEVLDGSGIIQITGTKDTAIAKVTHTTPAFVSKVTEYDYFLNFPSGMAFDDDHTIISYGNGDSTSHLLFIPHQFLDDMMVPIETLTPAKFKFIHGVKDNKGYIS